MSDRMIAYISIIIGFILYSIVPVNSVDETLLGYKQEFLYLARQECDRVKEPNQFIIQFSKLRDEEAGVCIVYPFKKIILIDEYYWESADPVSRKQLIFHELSHCLLNKEHVENPENYMNAYVSPQTEESLYEQTILNIKDYCNEQR